MAAKKGVKKKGAGDKKGVKKESLFDNALSSDPVFMKEHLEDTKRTYRQNLTFLENIRDGAVSDSQYDPKTGGIIVKPVAMDVRVKAISQINAMTLHKVMADKKESGREKDGGKGIDHEESLKRIADEIIREKATAKITAEVQAFQAGKLAKMKEVQG